MTKQQSSVVDEGNMSDGNIDSIVVIPALNEASHIETVLTSLLNGQHAYRRFELWVVDGGSDDGTVEIVERRAVSDPGIQLLHNPGRTQSCAVNLAAHEARRRGGVKYLIRADAHSVYPPGWVSQLIKTAEEENADSVVVPMRTCGGGAMRNAAADLFNSRLGNGGSPHRVGKMRGFVDHGHHALFRLEAFLEAGGYDPEFLANEDAELDVRLRRLGRRIFLENKAMIGYLPRNSLQGLARQFYRNGCFRVCTSRKHRSPLGARQLAPMALTATLIASMLAGTIVHPAFLVPALAYLGGVLIAASFVAASKSFRRVGLVFLQAVTAHNAFGFGALSACVGYLPRWFAPISSQRPQEKHG